MLPPLRSAYYCSTKSPLITVAGFIIPPLHLCTMFCGNFAKLLKVLTVKSEMEKNYINETKQKL